MHGQMNYTAQVSHGAHAPPPAFLQQSGVATATTLPPPPPTFHHGLLGSQPQVIRSGNPTFPLPPGNFSFTHILPGAHQQGPIIPVVSKGMNSGQSYLTHPPAPPMHGTQTANSYLTFEPQHFPWNQNVHQISQSVPLPVPRGYLPPPSSQGYSMERGPPPQPPSKHAPPPLLPPYSSTSSFSIPDPFVSTAYSRPQHSYLHSVGPLPLPPSPPPPPLPHSSPPVFPPLPSFAPPNVSEYSESHSVMVEFPYEGDLISKHNTPQVKPAKDRNALDVDATEISPAAEEDATFTHPPSDSDMVMEDDITLPDEEKHSCLSKILNEGCVLLSQEVVINEQLEGSLHAGGHSLPLDGDSLSLPLDGDSLNSGSSISQVQRLGSEIPLAFEETSGRKLSDQLDGGANPFELLQGYTSEDSSENDPKNHLGDVGHPSTGLKYTDFDAEKGCNFTSDLESNKPLPLKSMIESLAPVKADEYSDKNLEYQESSKADTFEVLQTKDSSRSSDVGINHLGDSFQMSALKSNDTKLNVDEFGRLVREGVSDSDTSYSPRYGRRHARRSRKQRRSQSRSRSPRDSRSPIWRNERRHKSRSLSPKRRRSRSKSPVSRRGSEFDGNRLRRDKGQCLECFNFLRGKCYRGASCRYSHHEADQSEKLRYSRGKQLYHGMLPTFRSPDFLAEKTPERKSTVKNKEGKDKAPKLPQKMPGVKEVKNVKELSVDPITNISNKLNSSESVSPLVTDVVARHLSNSSSYDMSLGSEDPLICVSPAQILYNDPQLVGQRKKQIDDSLVYQSPPVQASAAVSPNLPTVKLDAEEDPVDNFSTVGSPKTEPYSADKVSSQSMNSNELSPYITKQPYQLSLPLTAASQVMRSQFGQGIPQDYNLMRPAALIHSTTENYPLYQTQVSSHQPSLISEPSNSSSSSFHPPLQPPQALPHTHVTLNATIGDRSILSQQHTQQSLLPARNGLSSYTSTRPYLFELPIGFQSGQYQAYRSARETDQRPLKLDEVRSNSLHVRNLMNHECGRHIFGEDYVHSIQGKITSNSSTLSQPISFPMQALPMGTNAFPVGSLPSTSNPSHSNIHSQSEYYGVDYPVAHRVSAQSGEPGNVSSSVSRIASDFLEKNHPYHVPDFMGSRIYNHYSPYPSTFDNPPSSQPTSNALIQEKDPLLYSNYGLSFGLSSDPVHGNRIGNSSLTNMISLSTSARAAEGNIHRVVSKQYDPLFDSIEPAPNSFGRADRDSYDFLRFKKEGGAILSAGDSPEIEEYGETEDAEVGVIMNGDLGNPRETAEMNAGESEIDQVKESGRNKKGKDSRSMRLFKISIAAFVKEVLKPSWRQGNMSKEAFKTIVKKTVGKVSSAMKSHKIPKSQAKINHYIDSSRGKLTKLVMGYVDKYVKA